MMADSDMTGGLARGVYTYNSRGLGPAAGFLTGWMMIFAYALFVPAGSRWPRSDSWR